jgi:hypothetical protein
MSVSNNAYLPTYDELYVPPLNLTSPVLKAGAIHFGLYCMKESNVSIKIPGYYSQVNCLFQ